MAAATGPPAHDDVSQLIELTLLSAWAPLVLKCDRKLRKGVAINVCVELYRLLLVEEEDEQIVLIRCCSGALIRSS